MRLLLIPLVLLIAGSFAAAAELQPPLDPAHAAEWVFPTGDWSFADGMLRQTNPDRQAAAILREPAFGKLRLSVDFRIEPQGNGVRTAAIIFSATGSLTYYWLHLDSKFRQVIFVRSTPEQTWIEIGRRKVEGLTDDAWHTAVVEADQGKYRLLLDGAEVLAAEDTNLTGGRIGLGTSQGVVQFRNLKLEGDVIAMDPLREEQPPFQVISRGEAAGPYQAFPDACRLQNGDIMCVFYGGYGHVSLPTAEWPKGGRICYVRSSDEGRTWTAPAILYDDDQDNRDPHLAQLKNGTLVSSFFSYWKDGDKTVYRSMITRSTDGGKTWSEAQPVTPELWAVSAPVRELPDGTLILGVYSEVGGPSYGGVVRSTDGGKTWGEPIPIGKEANLPLDAETDVILLRDGTLYAALRSSSINMHYATSPDLGLTWSTVKDIGFKGHAPHFTRLSSGEILMTHRIPNTALHVSRDECRTWEGPYQIDSVGGAYPATVELKDKSVLAIYYEEGEGSAVRALRFKLKADGIEPLEWGK